MKKYHEKLHGLVIISNFQQGLTDYYTNKTLWHFDDNEIQQASPSRQKSLEYFRGAVMGYQELGNPFVMALGNISGEFKNITCTTQALNLNTYTRQMGLLKQWKEAKNGSSLHSFTNPVKHHNVHVFLKGSNE